MKKICIITARGGSKRIPRKNIRDFIGKPIISYSIEAALKSELFDEVMVSTDDEEIAKVSKEYGASVPFFRSLENSDDFSTTADVIYEVLQNYNKDEFDYFCCLYPAAPFVTALKLKDSFDKLLKTNADSLIPVVSFGYPPQRGLIIKSDKLKVREPQNIDTRSQDLEKIYHDVGQFYWGKVKEFIFSKKIFCDNSTYFEISPLEAQDIDNIDDWKLAEIKYRFVYKK